MTPARMLNRIYPMRRIPTMREEFRAAWDRATSFQRLRATLSTVVIIALALAVLVIAAAGPR